MIVCGQKKVYIPSWNKENMIKLYLLSHLSSIGGGPTPFSEDFRMVEDTTHISPTKKK